MGLAFVQARDHDRANVSRQSLSARSSMIELLANSLVAFLSNFALVAPASGLWIPSAVRTVSRSPGFGFRAQLACQDEAREAAAAALRRDPDFTFRTWLNSTGSQSRPMSIALPRSEQSPLPECANPPPPGPI